MKLLVCIVALCATAGAYVFGAVSYHRGLWPIPELRALKQSATPFIPANGVVTDKYERLVGYRGKREIPCPPQTDRTFVLLTAGQSNAANSGGQRYEGRPEVVNYFAGKCYAAASPLLGATGIAGDSWTLLGNKLIESDAADHVVLIASGMSGTSITKWQEGGPLNPMLRSVISHAKPDYQITHILWHQGEWDVGAMSKEQYRDKFLSLVESIRSAGSEAPVYVSVATKCELTDIPWNPSNEIALAQKALPDPARNIRQGVNTDELLGPLDRIDDCHFAGSGQEKFAIAWISILVGH
jgi:carbohydrate esterase-like sialic acid-specific acetylesterase